MEPPERPADRLDGRLARDAEARHVRRERIALVEPPRLAPGHVQAALGIDAHPLQQPVDPAHPQLGEIGQPATQVRRADRRQAQDAPRHAGSASSRRESSPPMLWPIRWTGWSPKASLDLLAQPLGSLVDAGQRRDPRHQDPVPRRLHRLGNPAEIRREGHRTHADPRESAQSVGQHDRRVQPRKRSLEGCISSLSPHSSIPTAENPRHDTKCDAKPIPILLLDTVGSSIPF